MRHRPSSLVAPTAWRIAAIALASGLIGAGILTGLLYATGATGNQTKITSIQQVAPTVPASDAAPGLNGTGIYSTADPGVVDITATGISSSSTGFPFVPPHQMESVATGTGFEIDSQGDILTAAHVVSRASSVTGALADGTTRRLSVIGVDRSTDTAVLKMNPSGLTLHPLPLGSSQSLAVGDPLAVIGDPFDYDRSLSTGVVSALDRTIQAPNGFTIADAIQTDAAINPGNSGGPVFNAQGQVVGITDQIATSNNGADSFSGVGFAVPIDDVKGELSRLEHGIKVVHAYLGTSIAQAPGEHGALIASVQKGSPAAAAGLRTGDLVTAIDGTAIQGANGLVAAIATRSPGDKLMLTVQRGSRHLTITAALGKQPSHS